MRKNLSLARTRIVETEAGRCSVLSVPETEAQIEALRKSVNRGTPYGSKAGGRGSRIYALAARQT